MFVGKVRGHGGSKVHRGVLEVMVGLYPGDVGLYAGDVGLYDGDVSENVASVAPGSVGKETRGWGGS